jgi:hypothetical protein
MDMQARGHSQGGTENHGIPIQICRGSRCHVDRHRLRQRRSVWSSDKGS